MGTFQITVEIGDQSGQRFQELEALVDTGATFTKVPRSILRAIAYERVNVSHSGESRNPVAEPGSLHPKIRHPSHSGLRLSPE